MDKIISNGKMEITCNKDITKYYKLLHNSYLSSLRKPSLVQREWMTLISFLNKNMAKKCKTLHLTHPFTILKRERPDFELVMSNRSISIEIVRVISKNLEAIRSLSFVKNKSQYESDPQLYDDDAILKKSELDGLFLDPDESLYGVSMYGNYKEKKWAELCYAAILAKSNKDYKMDILLLDDQHVQSCHEANLMIGMSFLKQQLNETPIPVSNINCIVSEIQSGLILLYDKHKWLFEYKQFTDYDY